MNEDQVQEEWKCSKCGCRNLSMAQTCISCGERNPQQTISLSVVKPLNSAAKPLNDQSNYWAFSRNKVGIFPSIILFLAIACFTFIGISIQLHYSQSNQSTYQSTEPSRTSDSGGSGLAEMANRFKGATDSKSSDSSDVFEWLFSGCRWLVGFAILSLISSIVVLYQKKVPSGLVYAAFSLLVGIGCIWWSFPKMESVKSGMFQLGMGAETLMGGHSGMDFVNLVQFHYFCGLSLMIFSAILITAGLIINNSSNIKSS